MQIKTKIISSHTADSKLVKQEVNSTVILPPLVFPFYDYDPGPQVILYICRNLVGFVKEINFIYKSYKLTTLSLLYSTIGMSHTENSFVFPEKGDKFVK